MQQINVTTGTKRCIQRAVPGATHPAPPAPSRSSGRDLARLIAGDSTPADVHVAVAAEQLLRDKTISQAEYEQILARHQAGTAAAAAVEGTIVGTTAAAVAGSSPREQPVYSSGRDGASGSRRPKYWSRSMRDGKTFVVLDPKSAEFRRVATMVRSTNRNKEACMR